MRAKTAREPGVAIPSNPDVLTEIVDLRRRGVRWGDICKRLRISRNTYYRCLASIEAFSKEGLPL